MISKELNFEGSSNARRISQNDDDSQILNTQTEQLMIDLTPLSTHLSKGPIVKRQKSTEGNQHEPAPNPLALNLNKLLKIDLNGNSDQDPEDEQEDKNMTERVHKDNVRQTGNTTNTVNQS